MNKNIQRELQKADAVLEECQRYFEHMARMNATLHAADEVYYSPLHAKIVGIRAGIKILLPQPETK
jgi:hypothetical protein